MERSGRDGVNGERSGIGAWGRGEGMRRGAARVWERVGTGLGGGLNGIGKGLEWERGGGDGGG